MKTAREIMAETHIGEDRRLGHDFAHHIENRLADAGYVIVPKEPTEEMYQAAEMEVGILQIYRAMIAAKP